MKKLILLTLVLFTVLTVTSQAAVRRGASNQPTTPILTPGVVSSR